MTACGPRLQRRVVSPKDYRQLNSKSEFLKAHMRDGDVFVMREWSFPDSNHVLGLGVHLDPNRDTVGNGDFLIACDSVALFETNVLQSGGPVAAMTVLTAASIGMTVYCISNPKACFGSCPTFYTDDFPYPLAEGFSVSVAPSLEDTDIDALYPLTVPGKHLTITMRNEALETHVVRAVNLLVAPHEPGERVFADVDRRLWAASQFTTPLSATATEGDVTSLIAAFDHDERSSAADSTDLAAREEITLRFVRPEGDSLALVLAARQTLLSTYLFYQALAYMGTRAGEFLSRLERVDTTARALAGSIGAKLGGIEVMVSDGERSLQPVGCYRETGPLATDCRLIGLPPFDGDTISITLRLTKGCWRLDWVSLVAVEREVSSRRISPSLVRRNGVIDTTAHTRLLDTSRQLVTFPGDNYAVSFDLSLLDGPHEYFLESRGYYLEWMREEWLSEEDPVMAAYMLLQPAAALKTLAPVYKAEEAQMEDIFWNSRYESR